jgi:hypothetical protein
VQGTGPAARPRRARHHDDGAGTRTGAVGVARQPADRACRGAAAERVSVGCRLRACTMALLRLGSHQSLHRAHRDSARLRTCSWRSAACATARWRSPSPSAACVTRARRQAPPRRTPGTSGELPAHSLRVHRFELEALRIDIVATGGYIAPHGAP